MTQETKQPLYKVLDANRTQGNWTVEHKESIYSLPNKLITRYDGNCHVSSQEDKANAQYTALAVNNLAKIADALQHFVSISEQRQQQHSPYEAATLNMAKEALKAIS